MEVSDVIKMADKGRSEFGKSVKNPLLTGASVGFPFDNFPGSSLLVPVRSDSPPVLLEDVGEVDTFVGQEKPAADNVKLPSPSTYTAPVAATQGYTGIFSAFFGSSQPETVEPAEEVKPSETRSVASTPRSFSPYVHVPSVESYSPALFVPSEPSHAEPIRQDSSKTPSNWVTGQPTQAFLKPVLSSGGPLEAQPFSHFIAPSLLPSGSEIQSKGLPSPTSSSSSDSIVTDLQKQFAGTSISEALPVEKDLSEGSSAGGTLSQHSEDIAASHGRLGIFSSDESYTHSSSDFFGTPQDSHLNSYQTQSPAQHSYGAIGQPRGPLYSAAPIPSSQAGPSQYSRDAIGPPKSVAYQSPASQAPLLFEASLSPLQTPPQVSRQPPPRSVGFNPPPIASALSFSTQQLGISGQTSLLSGVTPTDLRPPPSSNTGVNPLPTSVATAKLATQQQDHSVQSSYLSGVPATGARPPPPSSAGFGPLPASSVDFNPSAASQAHPPTSFGFNPPAAPISAPSFSIQPHLSTGQLPLFSGAPPTEGISAVPPNIPGPTKSYRLGAQRRLAYAPVPGLASSPLSQNVPPTSTSLPQTVTSFNPQGSGPPPNLYNPNVTYHASGETATPPLFPAATPPSSLAPPSQPLFVPSSSPDTVGPPTAQPAAFVAPPAGDVLPPAFVPAPASAPLKSSYGATTSIFTAAATSSALPPSQPPVASFPASYPSPTVSSQPDLATGPFTHLVPTNSIAAAPKRNETPLPESAQGATISPLSTATSATASSVFPQSLSQPATAPFPSCLPSSIVSSHAERPIESSTLPTPTPHISAPFKTNEVQSNLFTPVSLYSSSPNTSVDTTSKTTDFYTFTPLGPAPLTGASNLFTPIPTSNSADFFNPASTTFPPPPPAMAAQDDPNMLNTVDLSTPAPPRRSPSPSVVPQRLLSLGQSGIIYRPPYYHWFWSKDVESRDEWQPFSMTDSFELEQAFNSAALTMDTVVATDGGRHDVQIVARRRDAVYWNEPSRDVRRCSWFYKSADAVVPYDENTSAILEEEYKAAVMTSSWNRQVPLTNGAYVVLFGPTTMVHYSAETPSPDAWEASTDLPQSKVNPREVKRGVEEFNIEDGEPAQIDHLLFFVHGIGSVCDLKMRSIEEAVRDFRNTAQELIKTHYRSTYDRSEVTRIEVLPVSWHQNLHSDTGVDDKLKKITLKSIPRLRHFTNDTLLDILFYTSPVFCQNIVQQVGQELNKLYELFRERNPSFGGGVSVAGHSLGSLILFDMLCHQKRPTEEPMKEGSPEDDKKHRAVSRTASYIMGNAGTGQPCVTYPQLNFQPNSFFALGSPIGMFVTVRGIDSLGLDFQLPTCPGFYNIFHPYDPVAYRIEVLINPDLASKRPVLIPHHKGRKRMHLELRDTVARLGSEFKQRVVDSVRSTWNAVYQFATLGREQELEQEVDRALESEIGRTRLDSESTTTAEDDDQQGTSSGVVNQGRRVDYVLQEAPLESLNEYLSAIVSHVCYWDSEDTVLFILKDIYNNMGITADSPAVMTADDKPPTPASFAPSPHRYVDPTAPPARIEPSTSAVPIQPPPTFGFVRK